MSAKELDMTLIEFLRARIAEDEGEAQSLLNRDSGPAEEGGYAWCFDRDYGPTGMLDISPVRVLAECEAKRRIIERQSLYATTMQRNPNDCPDLLALALPYADHPDCDPEWRL